MEIKDSEKINEFNGCSLVIATYSPDYILNKAKKATFQINNNCEELILYNSQNDVFSINDKKIKNLSINVKNDGYINDPDIKDNDIYKVFLNTLFLKEVIASLYPSSNRIRKEKPAVSESLLFSLGYCFTFGISRDHSSDELINHLAHYLGNGNPGFKYWSRWDSHGIQLRFLELLFCYNGNIIELKHIKSIRDIAIVLLHPIVKQLKIDRDIDEIWDRLGNEIEKY